MFELAQRNDALDSLPCKTLEEMRAAYNFQDLQSFLNLYYAGCAVLRTEQVRACLLRHLQDISILLLWVRLLSQKLTLPLKHPSALMCACVGYRYVFLLGANLLTC